MSLGNLSIEEKAFFYSLNEHKTAVYEQWFEFDRDIDKEKLKEALRQTIKYFDRFGLKAVISKDGKPILVENDAELPIYEDDGKNFTIGTKETNGYLYAICIKGAKMRIIFFHMLCDGRGSGTFVCTLFLHYIMLAYGNEEAKIELEKYKLEDEGHKKNMEDTISIYANSNLKEEINKKIEFKIPEEFFIVDKEVKYFYEDSYFSTRIEWDAKKFIDVVHNYDTTPFVFIFMLIADAMIESFDVKEGNIISNTAVDLRKFLGSTSFYNFGTSINVEYKKTWHSLSIEDKINKLKESFTKSLDYNKMVADTYRVEQMMEGFSNVQNVDWLKDERLKNAGKINMPLFSCFISNIGKAVFPDVIAKYVKSLGTFATPINTVPDYTIFTYGDTGIMIQNQNFKSEKIMKKVFEKLESFGIKAKYSPEAEVKLSHFDTLKLDRI